MFNFFIGAVLIVGSLCNCSSPNSNEKMKDKELTEFCQSYVKAICTKDTVTFYKLVDKGRLTVSMNEWIQEGPTLTEDDLFFPFFFVYAPLKIRHQDLINERNKEIFFTDFRITNEEVVNDGARKLSVTWVQNTPTAKEQQIELTIAKYKEWKVIGAKWKTL